MAEALQPSWADLPLEVLQNVFKHVDDLQLLTTVAATCKPWRDAIHVSHRNSIDFSTLIDPYCVEDQDMHLVASLFGQTLQSINLSGCGGLTSASFECLQQRFPALKRVVLNGLSASHYAKQAIIQLAGVEHFEMRDAANLYLGGRFVSNDRIETKIAASIKTLDLTNTYCIFSWRWRDFHMLHELHVSHLSEACMEQLAALPSLRCLTATKCPYINPRVLGKLTRLTTLRLKRCGFLRPISTHQTEEWALLRDVLESMTELEELTLERISLPSLTDNLVLAVVHTVPQLQRLTLNPCQCTNQSATWLEQLPDLTHLCLISPHGMSAAALATITTSHPNLQQLKIPNCRHVHDDGLEVLVASAPKLEEISLSRWQSLSGNSLDLLLPLTHLTRVEAYGLHHVIRNSASVIKKLAHRGVRIEHRPILQEDLPSLPLPVCDLESRQALEVALATDADIPEYVACRCVTVPCDGCHQQVKTCCQADHATACLELPIPCVFASQGCDYQGNLQAQRSHRPHCRYNQVHCHQCDTSINRTQYEAHFVDHNLRGISRGPVLPLACPMRQGGCLFKSSDAAAVHQHITMCSFWIINCPCCHQEVPKSNWQLHASTECEQQGKTIPLNSMVLVVNAVSASEAVEV
eukprot:m.166079 g.166079  ORF g.166079 m.166079 type:complete len:637 (-) comp16610_c0_seq4:2182-4092(-)